MKILFFALFVCIRFCSFADNSITGNLSVTPNAVEVYTVNWENWNSTYENYANVSWTVNNGIVLSSDKHTVTIQWDDIPRWMNAEGYIEVYEDLGGGSGVLSLEIINYRLGNPTECSGVLGTPAVFISFGSGINPGAELPNGMTTYIYTPPCTHQNGQYSIVNNTGLICPNGNWLDLPADHTPNDVNGYMMLVDGDNNDGEVFRTTVTGLQPSFGYEFSAYLVNLADPNAPEEFQKPRLSFEIYDPTSGNLLQASDNFEVEYYPSAPWKKLSFLFQLPQGSSSVIVVLVNKNNSANGNDFIVDDISFAPCYPPILASFSPTDLVLKSSICNNGSVTLYSRWPTSAIPYSNPSFKWQRSVNNGASWQDIPNATAQNFSQSENIAGIFQYRIIAYETANPLQNVASNSITYFVQKMIVDAKVTNFYNCVTTPFQLHPTYYLQYADPEGPALNYTFAWTPAINLSSASLANPTINLPQLPEANYWDFNAPSPTPVFYTYNLTIQNTNFTGCIASGTQTIAHYNPRKVVVPTAFTPNNDGSNDLFRPLNLQDYPSGEFWIYNRWGNLVFHSVGPTLIDFSWNGKVGGIPQEMGAYTWQVTIPGCPTYILNGNGTNNPFGTVDLIR